MTMDTPVEGYENLDFKCEYRLPTVDEEGHFNGRLSTTKGGVFQFQAGGTTRDLSGSFSSPFEPFRYGAGLLRNVSLRCLVNVPSVRSGGRILCFRYVSSDDFFFFSFAFSFSYSLIYSLDSRLLICALLLYIKKHQEISNA